MDDLERLKQALKNGELKHTPGFFFGEEEIYSGDIQATNTFITTACDAIQNGLTVFYDS
ncbi:hypothetical protein [Neisseria iguanae]|uniref:hypothetical protein n=1 Tax=Neisseria iguanae TaxID=90242 RepID=UPI001FE37A05|nr:hypothetical protein [Neisseria iguanae]